MPNQYFNWKIAGEAGYGIKVTGLMFSKTMARGGLHIFDHSEYPSLIRGGHNTYHVTVSKQSVFCCHEEVDLLICLNQSAVNNHAQEVSQKGAAIVDSSDQKLNPAPLQKKKVKIFPIPLKQMAQKAGGKPVMQNTVALGATIALIDYDFEILKGVIRDQFSQKGAKVVNLNIGLAKKGYDYAKKNFAADFSFKMAIVAKSTKRLVITGNEAEALGAIRAGCKFLSAYPMTPSTAILHFLAAQEKTHNIVYKQTEDELAAIGMAIGASFTGARSMVCTSGGGFALMNEMFGMAGMQELPLVVAQVQRPGPATGLPTWTEQGDLRFMRHAAPGEFPRVILTPGDPKECFYEMIRAFNLADKYQTPVVVLTDKHVGESHKTEEIFDTSKIKIERGKILTQAQLTKIRNYKRYLVTKDGVSPRSLPGQKNGVYIANSDEHNEESFSCEDAQERCRQIEKRARKLAGIAQDVPKPKLIGPKKPDLSIISWGSTKSPVMEAMKTLSKEKAGLAFMHVPCPYPFPAREIKEVFKISRKVLVVENNSEGQLAGMIQEDTLQEVQHTLLKYSGRQFTPQDIVRGVKKII